MRPRKRKSAQTAPAFTKLFNANAEPHYKKPVVMLTGPTTCSAAEDVVAVFDMLDRGKIIGKADGFVYDRVTRHFNRRSQRGVRPPDNAWYRLIRERLGIRLMSQLRPSTANR